MITEEQQQLFSLEEYLALDQKVDIAEGEGIWARWEFGRRLLLEREANGGKQLPHGRIGEITEAISKSETEVRYRMQFAELYPTEEKVSNALETFGSWHEICANFGTRSIRSSTENEWYTPEDYIAAARRVMGDIDLDPASSPNANKTVKARYIFSIFDDGLAQPWSGRVWLNPPYGRLAGDFTRRLVAHYDAGAVATGILLVNAHCTDTDWFQPLWDHVLCFTDHRIDFDSNSRAKKNGSTHGSVFAYLGPNLDVFAKEFNPFGAVVRRYV